MIVDSFLFQCLCVLIDTWWNVNTAAKLFRSLAVRVLIDTWWNVNDGSKENEKIGADGFNRYMVECECIYKVTCTILRTVLIDTWWNVNLSVLVTYRSKPGFNRYMVECE